MNHFAEDQIASDNELLGLFVVNDDQQALEQILRRHAPMVMHVCRSFLWNPADCEDATQAVFVLLVKKSRSLLRHDSIAGWLHNVAVKTSQSRRRSIHRKREVNLECDLEALTKEPWESIANAQEYETLHLEISRLPKRYRDVIVLCHLNGMSRSVAAENLDTTTSAIKASLARARKLLRHRLMQKGIGLSAILVSAGGVTTKSLGAEQFGQLSAAVHGQCAATTSKLATATNTNLIQFTLTKGLSAMHLGIVQASLATALGLVTIGAVGLSGMASSPAEKNETVVVRQDLQSDDEVSAEIELPQEPDDSVKETDKLKQLVDQAENRTAEMEMSLQMAQARLGADHPNVKNMRSQLEIWKAHTQQEPDDSVKETDKLKQLVDQAENRTAEMEMSLQMAQARLGADHPNVKNMRSQLEIWKAHTQEGPLKSPTDDQELFNVQIYSELDEMTAALEAAKQKFADSHPQVQLLKAKISALKKFLPDAEKKSRKLDKDLETLKKVFSYKPRQAKDAVFSQPKSLTFLDLKITKTGFEVTDQAGNTLRRFLDTNQDKDLDTWIYFNLGRETYRDVDRNHDGRADESHFTAGDKIRIGIDKDQDGTIESWDERRLSDLAR